jgi:hypothetical protein
MTAFNTSFLNALPFSDEGSEFNLAANVALSFTVPGSDSIKYRAEFSYMQTSNVWVSLNGTATVPVAGTQGSTSMKEFRPGIRFVKGGDVLSVVTGDVGGAQVGISLLQI